MPVITAQAPLPTGSQAPSLQRPQINGGAPAQGAPPQAPLAEASAETPKEEILSPKFAALARKEKELRHLQKSLQAEKAKMQAELQAKDAEYKSKYIPVDQLKADPIKALTAQGYTIDQIAQMILNGGQVNSQDQILNSIKSEIDTLKQGQEARVKADEERQERAREQALTQIRNEAQSLVESDPNFETIKESGSVEAVVELIRETFDSQGTLLTVEQAAQKIEDYLLEEALKVAQYGKVKTKLQELLQSSQLALPQAPGQGQSLIEARKSQGQLPQPIKTLTNQATTGSSRSLTPKERRERAILAFKGQLNI